MKKAFLLGILGVLLLSGIALSDTVVGSNAALYDWRNWTTAALDENGKPYWDGNSSDYATGGSVGNYLTKTGAFAGGSYTSPGAIPFWGGAFTLGSVTDVGAFDPNFYFQNGVSSGVTLQIQISGLSGNNSFGWYAKGSPGVLHEIFAAGTIGTPTVNITGIPAQYGFYFKNASTNYGGPWTWYTESSNNTINPGEQHFAAFKENGSFWLGMEDLPFGYPSDKDYNDMIVKFTPQVPEPSTMLLLGFGVIGLGVAARRRFEK